MTIRDSDHLRVVTVEVGARLNRAWRSKYRSRPKVIVATHGARIAGGHKIKRGNTCVESQGMICSLQEIGAKQLSAKRIRRWNLRLHRR